MTILNIDEFRKLKVTDRKTWRKYCYDICTMCDWNVGEIKQYSDLYEYSGARSIIVVGLNYAKEVLNIKKEEIIIQNNTKEKKYSKAIQKLLLTKPEERKNLLKEITKTGEITLERLVIKIKEQVRDENQKNELLEVILPERKKELAISKEITMKKRKENQEEKDAQFFPLFENAISSDTITEANLISALSKDRYYRLLSLYKEKNPERYNKYIEKVNNNKNNIDDKLNNILKETIYKLLDNNSDRAMTNIKSAYDGINDNTKEENKKIISDNYNRIKNVFDSSKKDNNSKTKISELKLIY